MNNINRRRFLKVLGLSALVAPVATRVLSPEKVYALEVPKVELDETSTKAKQFGYYRDAEKVDTAKYSKRAGANGKTQFCSNCQLQVKGDLKLEGKEESYGVCSLFPEALVTSKGWCNTWIKKIG